MRQTNQQLSSKALPLEAVKQLKIAGFLDSEIEQFATAREPIDLTMPIWQRAMEARKEWVETMLTKGSTKTKIKDVLLNFYALDDKRTPWDFLYHVYKPKTVEPIKELIKTFHSNMVKR